MSWVRGISLTGFVAGLVLLAWAALQGDVRVTLVFVVPIVTGSGPAAGLGGLLAVLGALGWLMSISPLRVSGSGRGPSGLSGSREGATGDPDGPGENQQAGGILLIGPIPIAWGTDRSTLLVLVVVAFLLMGLALIFLWLQPY